MKRIRRRFSAAAKQRAVDRMSKGERSRLYQWKDRAETGLPFSESGRLPVPGQKMVHATELEAAQVRIQELERKVGQQTFQSHSLPGNFQRMGKCRLFFGLTPFLVSPQGCSPLV